MTYMINARLEQGAPSLTLVDTVTGEERLNWQCEKTTDGRPDWSGLFKQLVLISCADRLNLLQRSRSSCFGKECIYCNRCTGLERQEEIHEIFYSAFSKSQ